MCVIQSVHILRFQKCYSDFQKICQTNENVFLEGTLKYCPAIFLKRSKSGLCGKYAKITKFALTKSYKLSEINGQTIAQNKLLVFEYLFLLSLKCIIYRIVKNENKMCPFCRFHCFLSQWHTDIGAIISIPLKRINFTEQKKK